MQTRTKVVWVLVAVAALLLALGVWNWRPSEDDSDLPKLRVALAPYQDMAMLVNFDDLGLDQKYGLDLELVTVPWEELYPTVASAGRTVDVSFGGLIEFLNKVGTLNAGSNDPVEYFYPAYVFKGASFVTFSDNVPDLTDRRNDQAAVRRFLDLRIGAQKFSTNHMLLYDLAVKHEIPFESVNFIDVPENDALLAARSGSLDVAGAGLTHRSEALRTGGRVVLDNQVAGFADVTGFVAKASTLANRREDIEKLLRMWFDSVAHVTSDIEENSTATLDYLARTSATTYTVQSFREALANEYFPTSLDEANRELIAPSGSYSVPRIASIIGDFLQEVGLVKAPPATPDLIEVEP